MQRRPSRRQQHASPSPGTVAVQPEDENGKPDVVLRAPARLSVLYVLPVLAIVALVLHGYYSSYFSSSSRLFNSLHNYASSSPSRLLDMDNRVYENEQLRPEDHIYRNAKTHTLNWSITAGQRRPDGVDKKVYLVNNLFPGPTIEARSGDTLQILVHNDLEEEQVSLHWHGLTMRDANTMDGAIGVTQCGIQPGQSFWYNFTIADTQSGTFWYHAHSSIQRSDGLYGGLVVHRPVSVSSPSVRGLLGRHQDGNKEDRASRIPDNVKYSYDKEILLLIGDWYHRPAQDVASWYLWWGSRGYEPVPDSLLINGAGRFNCSRAVPARPVDCTGLANDIPPLILDEHSSYRVRVVNTGSLTGITLGFAKETLQVITLDGGIPVETDPDAEERSSAGILFPGQRMDFVLRPSADRSRTSLMTVKLDETDFKIGNPALVPLQFFQILPSRISPESLSSSTRLDESLTIYSDSNIININNLASAPTIRSALPAHAQQTHLVYAKVEKLARLKNIPHGFFNRTTYKTQSDPPYPLLGLPRSQWDKNQLSVSTGDEAVWVDLIVNNLDEGAHPFHFHGHDFYIIDMGESADGSTWGSYNPWESGGEGLHSYDLTKAVLRDTVQIPRRGYAVLRFRADNPGVWLFHCHVMWHLAGGMAMLIDSMNSNENAAHHPWLGMEGMECRV